VLHEMVRPVDYNTEADCIALSFMDYCAPHAFEVARRFRALGKTVIAGLQATLLHYLKGEALDHIPVWQMIAMDIGHIESRATALAAWLREANGVQAEVMDGWSKVGGGSLPEETLPTHLVAIRAAAPHELAQRLRLGSPPVIGRIEKDAFLLDLRTVLPIEEAALRRALEAAL